MSTRSTRTPQTRKTRTELPIARARIRSVLDRLRTDGPLVDGAQHDVRAVSIPAGEGEALTRWVVRERAVATIEIGLAHGVSALHICDGLVEGGDPKARHVVVDPFQASSYANGGLRALEEAGVRSLVEHHEGASQIVLPAFLAEGRRFDLAFVDGNHRFDAVFVDLFYLGRLVRRGGVLILDDYDLPGIRRAVSFFLTNLGWRVEDESPESDEHRWIVLRTAEKSDDRDFRYFVDF